MSTPLPFRLPWRAIVRSANKPSNSFLRAPCTANSPLRHQQRHISDEGFDPSSTSTSQAQRQQWMNSLGGEAGTAAGPPATILSTPSQTEVTKQPSFTPEDDVRLPRAVQAAYLRPLRRQANYGIPTCDLQLRSYSIRNLEFFADFALRAAYFLKLPAYGPVPLPRIVERWTVPRGSFIHKKSQENFERRTVRRLIQIRDGEAETQELWLAFLRKHAFYGVGMKANVWEFAGVETGKEMDERVEQMRSELESTLGDFAYAKHGEAGKRAMEVINRENSRAASGGTAPMIIRGN